MHWTRRIKQENQQLKAENEGLKSENAELKKAVVNTERGDPTASRPDGLIISLTDSGVNDIRQANNDQTYDTSAHLAILADDEVEIRVESRDDIYKYAPIAGTQDIVGHVNPQPSWKKATEYTRQWLKEHNNLNGLRIVVFDPYGFMEQFDGLNIVKSHIAHEYWRTEEGMRELEEADRQRQQDEFNAKQEATPSWWRVRISMHWTQIDGKSVKEQWLSAKNEQEKAQLLKRVREAITPTYPDGSHREYKLEGFQLNGEYGQTPKEIQFGIPCDEGQAVTVHFDGKLPGTIHKEFIKRNDDDTHSPTKNTGGASISFESIGKNSNV